MAATKRQKAKDLFLHLTQKRIFIKEAAWYNILEDTISIYLLSIFACNFTMRPGIEDTTACVA